MRSAMRHILWAAIGFFALGLSFGATDAVLAGDLAMSPDAIGRLREAGVVA